MGYIQLKSDDQTLEVGIEAPKPDNQKSVLAIAFPKSGSVMFDGILRALCDSGTRAYFRLDSEIFSRGYRSTIFNSAISSLLTPYGYVYGVFRTILPAFEDARINQFTRLFLVRDPRDAIVSYYFSMKYSHAVPSSGTAKQTIEKQRSMLMNKEINDAITSNFFAHFFGNLEMITRSACISGSTLYRYEDVVFSKRNWIIELAKNLEIEVTNDFVDRLVKKFDIIPNKEEVNSHVRQVNPGDYKRKLRGETIEYLHSKYCTIFEPLGYHI